MHRDVLDAFEYSYMSDIIANEYFFCNFIFKCDFVHNHLLLQYLFGGRRRSRTPSLLREPGFQGQSQDQPRCIIFHYFLLRLNRMPTQVPENAPSPAGISNHEFVV